MQSDELDNALWHFATHFYAKPNIADFLLTLQDKHGLDINLMLLMLYLDQQKQSIDKTQLMHIMEHSKVWQEKAAAMRALRRSLKPLDNSLYQQAQAFELSIEQHYISALFRLSKTLSASISSPAAANNMNTYLQHSAQPSETSYLIQQCHDVFLKARNSTSPI